MERSEIDAKLPSILEFSELASVISHPLKTYSSGMTMRLAFSIAMYAEPECFLIDEALSVGDAHFQQKCIKRIKRHKEQGGTIIFVSHDMNAVKVLCDEVVLLDRGKVVMSGSPEDAVNHYNYMISMLNDDGDPVIRNATADHSFGVFSARLREVTICGLSSGTDVLSTGSRAEIQVMVEAAAPAALEQAVCAAPHAGRAVRGDGECLGWPLCVVCFGARHLEGLQIDLRGGVGGGAG